MASSLRVVPVVEEAQLGVTIAIAILLRIEGGWLGLTDVEQWKHDIEATLLPLLGANGTTPAGVAIRTSDRDRAGVAEALILNAAVDCQIYFTRARQEEPTCTVVHTAAPSEGGLH